MSAKRKVLANSFLYTFSSLLVKAMGFFLLPIYTEFLLPDDYGIINLVNSFIQVATFIVAFSLYSAVVRFYTDYKEDRLKLKRFYGSVITFVIISGITTVCIGVVFNKLLISWVFKGVSFYPVVLIALITLIFISLHKVHQNVLQGMQQGKKLTIINLVVFGLQVALNLLFIGVFGWGAIGVLLSTLLINFLYMFYMIVDLKKSNLIILGIDGKILKEALKYSIPLLPHNLSTHIASLTSRIFINTSGTLASVGLYSISMQFGLIIDTVQTSVNTAFLPWFYETVNNDNSNEKKDNIISLSRFLLILYSLLYMTIGVFSQEVIILMTNESYIMAWTVIPILVAAYSMKSIYYFYVNILLYYKDASKKLFIATITGSLSDIVLAYFLVPHYGMYGAAYSFLIAKIVVVTIVVIISKKYNKIGYQVTSMLRIIVPSLLFMGVGLYLSYTKYVTVFNWGNLFYKIAVLTVYLCYLFLTNRDMILTIIKSGRLRMIIHRRKLA